jgi:hypothetical protein
VSFDRLIAEPLALIGVDRAMNHDRERPDEAAATRVGDTSVDIDAMVGAIIQLWRVPNRIWPAFPTLVLVRAASWLVRGRAQRRSPAIGEGGVVSVFLDDSKVGTISPKQIQVYQVSPGQHSLRLHFLGGLRRSRKLSVHLAEGEEKQFVCLLNAMGWPSIRPATPGDIAVMHRQSSPVDTQNLPEDDSR